MINVVPSTSIAAEPKTGGTAIGVTADDAAEASADVWSPFSATDVKV